MGLFRSSILIFSDHFRLDFVSAMNVRGRVTMPVQLPRHHRHTRHTHLCLATCWTSLLVLSALSMCDVAVAQTVAFHRSVLHLLLAPLGLSLPVFGKQLVLHHVGLVWLARSLVTRAVVNHHRLPRRYLRTL